MIPKVYTASCMHHAKRWVASAHELIHRVEFTALWPYHANMESTPENCAMFWRRDFADIDRSDFLLCYAEDDDNLRGALVEAGYAIAKGIPVIVVGNHLSYGTWQYHSGVFHAKDLEDAMRIIDFLSKDTAP